MDRSIDELTMLRDLYAVQLEMCTESRKRARRHSDFELDELLRRVQVQYTNLRDYYAGLIDLHRDGKISTVTADAVAVDVLTRISSAFHDGFIEATPRD